MNCISKLLSKIVAGIDLASMRVEDASLPCIIIHWKVRTAARTLLQRRLPYNYLVCAALVISKAGPGNGWCLLWLLSLACYQTILDSWCYWGGNCLNLLKWNILSTVEKLQSKTVPNILIAELFWWSQSLPDEVWDRTEEVIRRVVYCSNLTDVYLYQNCSRTEIR